MASLKDIRTRIGSVKNTQKITKAMELVASARLRKAKIEIEEVRPYAISTLKMLTHVASRTAEEQDKHPLLAVRPREQVLLVVITSDRGLAGGFNSSITRAAFEFWKKLESDGCDVKFAVIGRKGRDFFTRRGANIDREFTKVLEKVTLEKSGEIGRYIVDLYAPNLQKDEERARLEGSETVEYRVAAADLDAAYIIYNEFKSAMTQEVVTEQLLPIKPSTDGGEDAAIDYIYEPSQQVVLSRLLRMYVEVEIFRALLESVASEHGARQTAMKSATDNASDMIGKLTLKYNRARQAAITTELMEIIGGAEALK